MNDADIHLKLLGAIDKLEQAAGVAIRDHAGASGLDVPHFPLQKLTRHFRLDNVVNACAAATPVALGQFHQRQIGDAFQELLDF